MIKCRTVQIYRRQSLSAVGEKVPTYLLHDGIETHSQLLQAWLSTIGSHLHFSDKFLRRYAVTPNNQRSVYLNIQNT